MSPTATPAEKIIRLCALLPKPVPVKFTMEVFVAPLRVSPENVKVCVLGDVFAAVFVTVSNPLSNVNAPSVSA
jgi:hypothetical protein